MNIQQVKLYKTQNDPNYNIVFDYNVISPDILKIVYDNGPDGNILQKMRTVDVNLKGVYLDSNKNFEIVIQTDIETFDFNYIGIKTTDNIYIFGFISKFEQVGTNSIRLYCLYDFWINNLIALNNLNTENCYSSIIQKHYNRYNHILYPFQKFVKGYNMQIPEIDIKHIKTETLTDYSILCIHLLMTEDLYSATEAENFIGVYGYRFPVAIINNNTNEIHDYKQKLEGGTIQTVKIGKLIEDLGNLGDWIVYSQLTYSVPNNVNNAIIYDEEIGPYCETDYFEYRSFDVGPVTLNDKIVKIDLNTEYEELITLTYGRNNALDVDPILEEFPFKYKCLKIYDNVIPIIFNQNDKIFSITFYYLNGQISYKITRTLYTGEKYEESPVYIPIEKGSSFTLSKDYYQNLLNTTGNQLKVAKNTAAANMVASGASLGVNAGLGFAKGGIPGAIAGGVMSLPNVINSTSNYINHFAMLKDAKKMPDMVSITTDRDETNILFVDKIIQYNVECGNDIVITKFKNEISRYGYILDSYGIPTDNNRQQFDFVKCIDVYLPAYLFDNVSRNKLESIFLKGITKYHFNIDSLVIEPKYINFEIENNEVI